MKTLVRNQHTQHIQPRDVVKALLGVQLRTMKYSIKDLQLAT